MAQPKQKPRLTPEEHKRRTESSNWIWYENRWKRKTYVKVERGPRFCEACGKQLRSNYKDNDRVCGHPKLPGKCQSACQVWKQRKDKNVKIRSCAICKTELENASANQKYCKRLPHIRRYFIDPRTECEIEGQKIAEYNWRIKNRNGRIPDEKFIGHANQNVPKKVEIVYKKRLCLGVLSNEEKGGHYFMSKGKHNRICDDCQNALHSRKTDTYKFSHTSSHRED